MPHLPLNLAKSEFEKSHLFERMPRFDEIYFEGHVLEEVMKFKAIREGQECLLFAVTLIRKDEDFLWHASRDLLDRAAKTSAQSIRGIHTFNLLAFDALRENAGFTFNELAQVMTNTSFKLRPGEERLVRYSSVFGLLKKMVDEPWGKVVFKSSVLVFNDKPNFLYTLAARILKTVEFARVPVVVILNDLSTVPLFDPANEPQQKFLKKLIEEQKRLSIDFPPEVYIQDRNAVRELLSGTIVT